MIAITPWIQLGSDADGNVGSVRYGLEGGEEVQVDRYDGESMHDFLPRVVIEATRVMAAESAKAGANLVKQTQEGGDSNG